MAIHLLPMGLSRMHCRTCMALSLVATLSDVSHPSYINYNLVSAHWKLASAHLVMETILMINYVKDYSSGILLSC